MGLLDTLISILPGLATAGVSAWGINQAGRQNRRQAQGVRNASERELGLYERARQDTLDWNAKLLDVALERQGYDREQRAEAIARYREEQGYGREQTERQWGAYQGQVSRQAWLDALTQRAYEENRSDTLGALRFTQGLASERERRAREATGVSREVSRGNLARAMEDYGRQAQYWEGVMRDPTSTPSWLSWAKEAEAAYDSSINKLDEDLTKRGISGGLRTQGLQRLETERAQGIGDALKEVVGNAEQQRANMKTPTEAQPQFHQAGVEGNLGGRQTAVQGLAGSLSYAPRSAAPAAGIPNVPGVSMGGMGMPGIPQVTIPTSSSPDYGSLGASLGWILQQLLGREE